jgi:hypothetical protein
VVKHPPVTANVESYDGTSWTETTNLNTARRALAGSGSQTAGLVYGGTTGSNTAVTEAWDGTSWTEVADLATARNKWWCWYRKYISTFFWWRISYYYSYRRMDSTNSKQYTNSELIWQIIKT